jgi:hypothetical protein
LSVNNFDNFGVTFDSGTDEEEEEEDSDFFAFEVQKASM